MMKLHTSGGAMEVVFVILVADATLPMALSVVAVALPISFLPAGIAIAVIAVGSLVVDSSSSFLPTLLLKSSSLLLMVIVFFGGTSLKIPWYWISTCFYVAKAPVLPLTIMALLAAGDPLP